MNRSLALAAGFVLALPMLAIAQPAGPSLQPGLWETNTDISGIKVGAQMCLDNSQKSAMSAFRPPQANAQQNCSEAQVSPAPGGFSVDTVCTVRGKDTRMHGVVTGDFKDHYRVDMTVAQDGQPERRILVDASRRGECPAGMKVGETHAKVDMSALAGALGAARTGQRPGN